MGNLVETSWAEVVYSADNGIDGVLIREFRRNERCSYSGRNQNHMYAV